MIETIEQLRAAVYGQAVGDALGVPYEFQDRDSFACANMIGHGTHNQPAGTWSDDTSMMLATLDSLIGNDWQVDIEDMQHRFNAWLFDILPRMNAGDSRISRFGFLFVTTRQEGRGR